MNQLLASGYPQFNDEKLKELAGSHWPTGYRRPFEILDMFKPKTVPNCGNWASDKNETAIAGRLVALLTINCPLPLWCSPSRSMRQGCGLTAIIQNQRPA